MSMKMVATAALALMLWAPAAVLASEEQPDWIMDTSGVGADHGGIVRSDQLMELGNYTPSALQLEGENSLRMGNIDTALLALQKSVEMAPRDMDKRTLYAQALERKLMKQKPKNPKLYNFVVKQWLFVYRKSEFIDQTLEAKQHLMQLAGTAPRTFERDDKYLSRVLIPEDGSTQVALGKDKKKTE